LSTNGLSQLAPSPRDRILEAARTLFYEEGIHSVSVDRIVERSGHPRGTLYRHFHGKEALVVEYLTAEDQTIRGYCTSTNTEADPAARLLAIVRGIAEDAMKHHRRGCPFINAAAEYPDSESPVRRAVNTHRMWFRTTLERAFAAAGSVDPRADAAALVMQRDAVLVGSYLEDSDEAHRNFAAAVQSRFGLVIS